MGCQVFRLRWHSPASPILRGRTKNKRNRLKLANDDIPLLDGPDTECNVDRSHHEVVIAIAQMNAHVNIRMVSDEVLDVPAKHTQRQAMRRSDPQSPSRMRCKVRQLGAHILNKIEEGHQSLRKRLPGVCRSH